MTRPTKRVIALLFTIANLGGAVFAVAGGELLHTAAHVGLMVLGAYYLWRLAPRAEGQQVPDALQAAHLDHLQQSVDSIALEVERIGEAQRYITKLAGGGRGVSPEAEPVKRRPDEEL